MCKILFLDIDGVLNSHAYDQVRTAEQGNIDETRLPLLGQLVERTQAQIVLTSSWRKHWEKDTVLCDEKGREINETFAGHGLTIFDKTPLHESNDRADEIRAWLSAHPQVTAFAILDDIAYGWGADLQEHTVRTNHRIGRGLEQKHVEAAIRILNGEKA